MKLLIISTCVVEGGKVVEAGQVHDTRHDDAASDRQAYNLIAAGRALDLSTDEAKKALATFEAESDKVSKVKK